MRNLRWFPVLLLPLLLVASSHIVARPADPPVVQFSARDYTASETAGQTTITVTLDAAAPVTVLTTYATGGGTAVAGSDYLSASGTLTFTPGITNTTFPITLLDDGELEGHETISLTLGQPSTGTLGLNRIAALTILDDERATVYLPLLARGQGAAFACLTVSTNQYVGGTAFQVEFDDPVRPAYNHADKNIQLRGYLPATDANLKRELVDYGSGDPTQPPQLATLFDPPRVPPLSQLYQVRNWVWAPTPDPGQRGETIAEPPVTALGLETTPGEPLRVPSSGYDLGGGFEVLVLFADADTVALRYTRDDSSGFGGYTVHIDNICTDPNLLALYETLDDPAGPRYVYVPPANRPYSYDLPNLPAGKPIGVARGDEVVVAIVDTGAFQDTRSCNEWWQIRPGYGGTCPPP
jgi:hypothetical protein